MTDIITEVMIEKLTGEIIKKHGHRIYNVEIGDVRFIVREALASSGLAAEVERLTGVERIAGSVKFSVVAYDESGYGDNRSREFNDGKEAVDYACSLESRFGATVWRVVTWETERSKIWPPETREHHD